MNNALQLLSEVAISSPHQIKGSVLFLNGAYNEELEERFELTYYQPFKPLAENLKENIGSLDEIKSEYAAIFLVCPKNVIESQYLISNSLKSLNDEEFLIIAAENSANGKRLEKWISSLSLSYETHIAHKSRCLIVQKTSAINNDLLESWYIAGQPQQNKEGFFSQPGLFSWDRIDTGSALLCDSIQTELKGHVADFGCGYGYLSQTLLQQHPKIKSLSIFDADKRALECCKTNTKDFTNISSHWCDLSKPYKHQRLFDVIVMNPPFHEGKKQDIDIGLSFIQNAAANLRKKGTLWVVANTNLPYERALEDLFWSFEKMQQKNGFKVLRADK